MICDDNDEVLRAAQAMFAEMLGHGAGSVDPTIRAKYPDVPWKQLIDNSEQLTTRHFDADDDALWRLITRGSRQLEPQLAQILAKLPGE